MHDRTATFDVQSSQYKRKSTSAAARSSIYTYNILYYTVQYMPAIRQSWLAGSYRHFTLQNEVITSVACIIISYFTKDGLPLARPEPRSTSFAKKNQQTHSSRSGNKVQLWPPPLPVPVTPPFQVWCWEDIHQITGKKNAECIFEQAHFWPP